MTPLPPLDLSGLKRESEFAEDPAPVLVLGKLDLQTLNLDALYLALEGTLVEEDKAELVHVETALDRTQLLAMLKDIRTSGSVSLERITQNITLTDTEIQFISGR